MLTVNVKETGNENKKEDTLTIHGTTTKEQNGLNTDEFKRKKKKEIKKKLENTRVYRGASSYQKG